jgi:hypothetical protein
MSFVLTSTGVVIRHTEDYFLKMERSVGRMGESFSPAVDRKMGLRATIGILKNMRSRVLP